MKKHYLTGYIADFINESGEKEKTVLIIEIINPIDVNLLTRILYLEEDGSIGRNSIGNTKFRVLPLETQIKEFNNSFYKYVPAPDHLKDYVYEEPQKLKK